MVQFKQLKVSGFKSFVDATELVIETGLTGVVGPNGCGKSNLVEALRWVMGETSAKQIRGSEMDQVIFGGTRDRPARNIAEVSLTLDNSDRSATAQFNDSDDLDISRRIERDKGSVYRVNGREVRARDVQLLFADVATGARSTGLVSQGQIGDIINSKPQKRRHLLEEAAGITGLHGRRHEAELRLQAAETNLIRLDDVLVALAAQLQGLRKQARQAARYRTITDSIRAANALVLYIGHSATSAELAAALSDLQGSDAEVADLSGKAASASTAQSTAAAAVPPSRQAEARAAAKVHRLAVAKEQLDEEERRVEESKTLAETRLAQINQDIEREDARIKDAEDALSQVNREREILIRDQDGEAEENNQARQTLMLAAKRVEELETGFAALSAAASQADTERATAHQKKNEGGLRRQRAERRLAEITAQLKNARSNVSPGRKVRDTEQNEQLARKELETARKNWETAENKRVAAQERCNEARDLMQTLSNAHVTLQAEATALEGVLAEIQSNGDWLPLLDAVTVEEGFEVALGAALGDDLIASTDESAPLNWVATPNRTEEPPLPSGVQPLANAVKGPEQLQRRLSQIGVVENSNQGTEFQKQLRQGQRLVTKKGDLWRWDGYRVRADAPTPSATRLKHRNRLRHLGEELDQKREAVTSAELDSKKDQKNLSAATEIEQTARSAVKTVEDAYSATRDALAELRQQTAAVETRISGLVDSHNTLTAEVNDAITELQEAQALLEELGDGATERQQMKKIQSDLAHCRQELVEARAHYDMRSRQTEERKHRIDTLSRETNSWSQRREISAHQKQELHQRHKAVEKELQSLAHKPMELAGQRNTLMDDMSAAENERNKLSDRLVELEAQLAAANKTLRQAEHSLAERREERVRKDSVVVQIQQRSSTIEAMIQEKVGCEPKEVRNATRLKEGEDAPDLELAERRLQRLLSERDNMGAINLRAEKESIELNGQITTLNTERDDLIGAIARLRDGITRLNREGRQRLLASFNEVDGHFSNLFIKLFGGGRAHLSLTDAEDPLEAGLEIMASPPGKRLQNLGLLSGGEQALTALALLFAVFLTNPAPICVLDEVDAPLDDANVDRFCNLLNEITAATATRMIIVTHHRMTMARVDRLYGVTMAERGVSKLVSVDLRQAEDMRESA